MAMSDQDSQLYNPAFVRFWSEEAAIGGGILLGNIDSSECYILTCAHVATAALGNGYQTSDPIPEQSISVDFPVIGSVKKLEAQVVWWKISKQFPPDKGEDIAILKLKNESVLLEQIKPLKLSKKLGDLSAHCVDIGGFPEQAQITDEAQNQTTNLKPATIFLEGTLGTLQGEGLRQIKSNRDNPYLLQQGLSGAPVWDDCIHKVVGIFTAADGPNNISWLIPNEEISSAIPSELREVLFVPDPIPPDPDGIQIKPYSEFQKIIDSIVNGSIVLFLGAGINPSIYFELCSRLSDLVGQRLDLSSPNNQSSNSLEYQVLKRQALVKQLIGVPCTTCPLLTNDRPQSCPIVDRIKRIWTDPLYIEQELVIGKLNFRYLAQYFRLINNANPDSFYSFYSEIRNLSGVMKTFPNLDNLPQTFKTFPNLIREAFRAKYSDNNLNLQDLNQKLDNQNTWPNDLPELVNELKKQVQEQIEVHKFFAQLPNNLRQQGYPRSYRERENRLGLPYPIIFTTKYDCWLEFAFKQNSQQPFETLHYKINNDLPDIKGSFIYKKQENLEEKEIEIHKDYSDLSVVKQGNCLDNSRLLKPLIIRLYGDWNDNFVITNEHFYNLLNELTQLPLNLQSITRNKSVLFVGYSPTDHELQLIVDQLQKLKIINKDNKSWLIHQLNPGNLGNLADEIWKQRNVELISINKGLSDFVAKLKEEIDKKTINRTN